MGNSQLLDRALVPLRGARKKRAQDLLKYLADNWPGIAKLPEEERLGTIEGQVRTSHLKIKIMRTPG